MSNELRQNAPLESEVIVQIEELRRGDKKAIKDAFRIVGDLTRDWRDINFPKDTGNLIGTTVVQLNWANEPYEIILKLEAEYASFVDAMEGVNWSRPTVEHFFEVLTELINHWLDSALEDHFGGRFTIEVRL